MLLEKSQRRLCRFLFVVGCVLPTLAVAGFTTARLRPSFERDLLALVGERLGTRLECERLQTPRPGVYVLRAVRASDNASGEDFLTCDELRVDARQSPPRFVARRASLRHPADRWGLTLLKRGVVAEGQVAQLQIDGVRFERVTVSLKPEGMSVAADGGATLGAKLAGGACEVTASTADKGVALGWLRCEPLGFLELSEATFAGSWSYRLPLEEGLATGAATGQVACGAVDLSGLRAARGSLAAEDLRWTGGRLERIAGRLELREGAITRPVVYGLCRWLAMAPFAALEKRWADPTVASLEFTQLACEVELDAKGLTLVAGCGELDGAARSGAVAHAVLEHRGEALLKQPTVRPLPAQRLVQAWRPDDVAELPATAEAIEMASRLPGMASQ